MQHTKKRGELGERIAEAFLEIKGYQILKRNYRLAGREIDILARRGRLLLAVEVKLRRGDRFGMAAEAVDARKLSRIRFALECHMCSARESLRPRIDLVVIDITEDMEEMTVTHLEGVY